MFKIIFELFKIFRRKRWKPGDEYSSIARRKEINKIVEEVWGQPGAFERMREAANSAHRATIKSIHAKQMRLNSKKIPEERRYMG